MTSTALAVQASGPTSPARVQLGGAMAMQQTIEDLNTIRAFVAEQMKEGVDFGVIPGTGGSKDKKAKNTLLQPGAQKTFMYFNCYPTHRVETHELDGGHVEYIVETQIISRTSQAQIGSGLGSCSTMESKYRYRTAKRRCPHCNLETVIKGKEDFGGGWLCYRKNDGCGAKFDDNDPAITSQVVGRIENPDIYDTRNTVLKMAKKRSQVDAALGLGCMSELFTQDVEDFQEPPSRYEDRDQDGSDRRREVNNAFPQRGQQQGQQDKAPRSGKGFFAWCKDQEQRHAVALLKYINSWAKLQEFPGRMVDWDPDQVSLAYAEACRKLQGVQPPTDDATPTQGASGASTEPAPRQTPAEPTWAAFVARTCNDRRTYWHNELAIAGVPQDARRKPENLLPGQDQVTNHFVNDAISRGSIKPADISKDGKPTGPRDPAKAKAAMAGLFREFPAQLARAVETYFRDKERELRVRLGMDDLDDSPDADTGSQDTAENPSQEEPPAGREPGCDDDL